MNTMMQPARIEGKITGKVTVHIRRSLFMPRFSAASSKELSMLFMHAQDTVMTIISEVNMIRLMIRMNRNLEDKINGNRN